MLGPGHDLVDVIDEIRSQLVLVFADIVECGVYFAANCWRVPVWHLGFPPLS
jgi:hypothetical protein